MKQRSISVKICWLLMMMMTGCKLPVNNAKKWAVSLDQEDKKPYGSWLAYESLKLYFPDARIDALSKGFRYDNIREDMWGDESRPSLFIALGLDFYVTDEELGSLLRFARKGNEVLIFSRALDDKIKTRLGCGISGSGREDWKLSPENDGTDNQRILTIPGQQGKRYGYQGRSIKGFFKLRNPPEDEKADTLGRVKNQPDFIRYAIGKGHITLHAAPLVMSNYFLLQDNNKEYLDALWQNFPAGTGSIYWNSYLKRTSERSSFSILMKYPATRWAFILAVIALAVYILFEVKRRQRIIPIIAPLENSSVSFVETVGRLYYNKHDHTNLAEKMIQHFLEWVRTHYYINTSQLDTQFSGQLTRKSGLPENVVAGLVSMMNEIHNEKKRVDEIDLYYLNNTFQQFYKNH